MLRVFFTETLELLKKDPNERLTLKQILQDSWITQDDKELRERRVNSTERNAFNLYTVTSLHDAELNESFDSIELEVD